MPESEMPVFNYLFITPVLVILALLKNIIPPEALILTGGTLGIVLLLARYRYPLQLKTMDSFYCIYTALLSITALYGIMANRIETPYFNRYFFVFLAYSLSIATGGYLILKQKKAKNIDYNPDVPMVTIFTAMVIFLTNCAHQGGEFSTFLWALSGILILKCAGWFKDRRFIQLAQFVLVITLLKSLLIDSSAVSLANRISFDKVCYKSGPLSPDPIRSIFSLNGPYGAMAFNLLMILMISSTFYQAGRIMRDDPRMRDIFQAYGLLIFSFQTGSLLFKIYGVLDNFQVILTIFWSVISFMMILTGLTVKRKIYRLFGLVLLGACSLKIIVVDISVLGFLFMAPFFFIEGAILLTTSFLYHKNRENLLTT